MRWGRKSRMPEQLRVELGSRAYDIIVGERILARAGEYIAPVLRGRNVIIVSDENVARFYLHRLTNALEEKHIPSRSLVVKSGEGTKSLASFAELMELLLEQKPDRKTTLIALGGGVIGDLTGFAASVLLRGVDFIQIPTTLLAQVDSSVGGKTGINSRYGKNLIGAFHQPNLVLADVSALSTLPKRELLAGYAEMVKYGFINDPEFFGWLEIHAPVMLGIAPSLTLPPAGRGDDGIPSPALAGEGQGGGFLLTQGIVKSCAAKAAIVAADEKENDVRALLNLGHTFGHALEAETGFSDTLLHGEAVAIGMVLAFRASVKMGICPEADLQRVLAHYAAVGLPASPRAIQNEWDVERLMEHFTRDKKTMGGKLTFILLRGIGKAFITQDVTAELLRSVLAQECGV
jgi:3-dehydroquinate synthase